MTKLNFRNPKTLVAIPILLILAFLLWDVPIQKKIVDRNEYTFVSWKNLIGMHLKGRVEFPDGRWAEGPLTAYGKLTGSWSLFDGSSITTNELEGHKTVAELQKLFPKRFSRASIASLFRATELIVSFKLI